MTSADLPQATLRPMSDHDFKAFAGATIPDYAADKVASGQWSKGQSLERARRELEALLPQGRRTADHYLFNILNGAGTVVGALWLARKEQAGHSIAYVYDLYIQPAWRRMGYATCALGAAEAEARRLGLKGIGLHVFGHNLGARRLYEKLGYATTNVNMFKSL